MKAIGDAFDKVKGYLLFVIGGAVGYALGPYTVLLRQYVHAVNNRKRIESRVHSLEINMRVMKVVWGVHGLEVDMPVMKFVGGRRSRQITK